MTATKAGARSVATLAELAGEVEDLRQRRALLDQAVARWTEYAETLREVVKAASGRQVEEAVSGVPWELLFEAEARRAKVSGPLGAADINLPGRVTFEPFLGPSLRTTEAARLFAAVAEPLNDSRILDLRKIVTWHVLEAKLADAASVLERTGLELDREFAVAQARLDAARAPHEPTLRGVLEKWARRGNVAAKAALWLFGHKLQVGLGAVATAAFAAILRWLRQ